VPNSGRESVAPGSRGVDYQVPLSEPEKANAIHGLLRWRSWRAAEHTPNGVVVATRLRPVTGEMLLWSCMGRARQRTEHLPGDVALEAAEDLALR
jgi:Aldose 1-epimerase